MKTYLINLDKNTDRLAFMDAQLKRMGMAYERFSAIYGKALSEGERARSYRKWRSVCNLGIAMNDGQIGCALSHLGVYRKLLDSGESIALVLEDDIVLDNRFPQMFEKARAFADPKKPQAILFSAWNTNGNTKEEIVEAPDAACSDAYLITAPAARIILQQNFPVVTVADRWHRWARRNGIEVYRAYPTTVRQDNRRFGTDIDNWTRSGEQRQVRRGLIVALGWKIFRACGLFIDWAIWRMTGK